MRWLGDYHWSYQPTSMHIQSIETISRAPTLVEQVCQKLAVMLRSERGRGAATLPAERELAAKLGVGRNVVREATKRLELQGMLEIRQGQGTRVVNCLHRPLTASLSLLMPKEKDRMRQLFEVRLMIEPQNARLAAVRVTKTQLKRIEEAQARLLAAASLEDAVAADMDFHREIARASDNQIAHLLLESLEELLALSHRSGFLRQGDETTAAEHDKVLKALRSGDGKAAFSAMQIHLLKAAKRLGLAMPELND